MLRACVVDDDKAVSEMLWRWLTMRGFQVECYDSFAEARVQLAGSPPDVLVSDIRLAGYNGLQLATMARAYRPDMVIIVISGWHDRVLEDYASWLGARYLQKPFSPASLDGMLQGLCASRSVEPPFRAASQ